MASLIEKDAQHQEFTNLEDENRSSLADPAHAEAVDDVVGRGAGAIWRDFANTGGASFRVS